MRKLSATLALVAAAIGGCSADAEDQPIPPAPADPMASGPPGADPVLVGAGDIATCDGSNDEATAKQIEQITGTVFTLGDNVYEHGSKKEFANCYSPSWGALRGRTRPAVGNHEYGTDDAHGYFAYFGAAAGDRSKGYYSYDLGNWHIVVVNSNCEQAGGCGSGSEQESWLRADLAATTKRCTLAYWHHPYFTSGKKHEPAAWMRPIVEALYDAGAEVMVTAHNHQYERFAAQTPDGVRDATRGIRAFVVGTGGAPLYDFGKIAPNSRVRNNDTYGVIKFTLRPDSYEWAFIPRPSGTFTEGGTFTDKGSGDCH